MFEINNVEYSVETALSKYLQIFSDENLEYEVVNVEDSLSRLLYEDIHVKADYPQFDRALVDGYAVRSADIISANEARPVSLKVLGEIRPDTDKRLVLEANQTMKISKGAFLPENADVVIRPEAVEAEGDVIRVTKSAIADSGVAKRGEDTKAGNVFIAKNRKIRPQDIGGIIGIGYRQIKVYKKPVVTIIPTGNELVPIDVEPETNQMFSSNGYVLKGIVDQLGGVGRISSIVKDDLAQVKSAISKALEISDMVLISGGSSIGDKDYTLRAIQELDNSKIVAHGVSMRPGNHVLLATVNDKPVIGLPGHPVSNMTSFHVFGKPVLRKLAGTQRSFWQEKKDTIVLDAHLSRKITSPAGKEDYVRVRLFEAEDGRVCAHPFTGKSSFLSTLVKSHGIIRIPEECTGLYEGDRVEVLLF